MCEVWRFYFFLQKWAQVWMILNMLHVIQMYLNLFLTCHHTTCRSYIRSLFSMINSDYIFLWCTWEGKPKTSAEEILCILRVGYDGDDLQFQLCPSYCLSLHSTGWDKLRHSCVIKFFLSRINFQSRLSSYSCVS